MTNLTFGATTGTAPDDDAAGSTLLSNQVDFGMNPTNRTICVTIESTTGEPLVYTISF